MANYLLELGTEELPYKFIPSAMNQLKEITSKALNEGRITYKNIKTYGTPRRLTLIIEDISENQPDLTKKVKGPPAHVALDKDGNLTKAGEGFAKRNKIVKEDFYKEKVGEIEYLFADIIEKGQSTKEALKNIIPQSVLKLQGSHFMRWGDLDVRFSRPIRWIVSILDNEEIKVKIGNAKSSKMSKGHRFSQIKKVEVQSSQTYVDDLLKVNVIVDPDKRQEEIEKQAQKAVQAKNGSVSIDKELLKEVNYMVEWPVAAVGHFDKKYLQIPDDVITTVMAAHQRYFPVYDSAQKNLLNYFITTTNYVGDQFENINKGNERVITARLDDAIFFYNEDKKTSLESKSEALKGITFQKGLGTVYDKSKRIEELAGFIANELSLDNETTQSVKRTAQLCKNDLVTSLVFEFTELQGSIGAEYAKLDNENKLVCTGIKEHYYPLSADSDPADSITGQIVGIADKIDTICGVFALGKSPTGSADPLGLRRAALGIITTILKKDICFNLSALIDKSLSLVPLNIEDKDKLQKSIREFITQRLRIYLTDSYKYDLIDAVLEANDPLLNLKDDLERLVILENLVKKENYNLFHESANRVNRIIKSEEYSLEVSKDLFAQDIEGQLWDAVSKIDTSSVTYNELVKKLEDSIPLIQKFFDDVLVMDPDEKIKNNRIALLGNLKSKFSKLADFSKIVL